MNLEQHTEPRLVWSSMGVGRVPIEQLELLQHQTGLNRPEPAESGSAPQISHWARINGFVCKDQQILKSAAIYDRMRAQNPELAVHPDTTIEQFVGEIFDQITDDLGGFDDVFELVEHGYDFLCHSIESFFMMKFISGLAKMLHISPSRLGSWDYPEEQNFYYLDHDDASIRFTAESIHGKVHTPVFITGPEGSGKKHFADRALNGHYYAADYNNDLRHLRSLDKGVVTKVDASRVRDAIKAKIPVVGSSHDLEHFLGSNPKSGWTQVSAGTMVRAYLCIPQYAMFYALAKRRIVGVPDVAHTSRISKILSRGLPAYLGIIGQYVGWQLSWLARHPLLSIAIILPATRRLLDGFKPLDAFHPQSSRNRRLMGTLDD